MILPLVATNGTIAMGLREQPLQQFHAFRPVRNASADSCCVRHHIGLQAPQPSQGHGNGGIHRVATVVAVRTSFGASR